MRHYAYTLTPEEQVAIVRHGLLHHPDIAAQRRRTARLVPITGGRAPNSGTRRDQLVRPFERRAAGVERQPASEGAFRAFHADPLRWWAALWLHAERPLTLATALGFLLCFWAGLWTILDWLVTR